MLFREICPHLKPNIKKKNNAPAAHKKHSTYKGKENQWDEVKKKRDSLLEVSWTQHPTFRAKMKPLL